MAARLKLWIRRETRATERRAPLTPPDAAWLVDRGVEVTVEESSQRCFSMGAYTAVGCRAAAGGSWPDAPPDTHIIGLKELPDRPHRLVHRHLLFGHAYKGQVGAMALLQRFAAGGGTLLDLEYLIGADGRRLAAFGYWAGYVGAALAVLHRHSRLSPPLQACSRQQLDDQLQAVRTDSPPKALVVGALGRCGRGARDALATAGALVTGWDQAETRHLDRRALLEHDVLVNAVLTSGPSMPLLNPSMINASARRLAVIADVTCDVGSPHNLLPIYDSPTTWAEPVRRLAPEPSPLDLVAIDNLPSLLPREASTSFSAELVRHLLTLTVGHDIWRRCEQAFHDASRTATTQELTNA